MSKFIEVSSQVFGLDWSKMSGFVIAVIQDAKNQKVLMVGVMNEAALRITLATGKVTFWSRTRNELWTKGETSGNFLNVCEILVDCDRDTLLIFVEPVGPTCHTGAVSCFEEVNGESRIFEEREDNV